MVRADSGHRIEPPVDSENRHDSFVDDRFDSLALEACRRITRIDPVALIHSHIRSHWDLVCKASSGGP